MTLQSLLLKIVDSLGMLANSACSILGNVVVFCKVEVNRNSYSLFSPIVVPKKDTVLKTPCCIAHSLLFKEISVSPFDIGCGS